MPKRSTPEPEPEPTALCTCHTADTIKDFLRPYGDKMEEQPTALPYAGFKLARGASSLPRGVDSDGKEVIGAFVGVGGEFCNPFTTSPEDYRASVLRAHTEVVPKLANPQATFTQREVLDLVKTKQTSEIWLAMELANALEDEQEQAESMEKKTVHMTRALMWLVGMRVPSQPGTCRVCAGGVVCKREALPAMIRERCTCKDEHTGELAYFMCFDCAFKSHTMTGKCAFCNVEHRV